MGFVFLESFWFFGILQEQSSEIVLGWQWDLCSWELGGILGFVRGKQ